MAHLWYLSGSTGVFRYYRLEIQYYRNNNCSTVRSAQKAINTPPPTMGQGAHCIEDYDLHLSHQIAKISLLHHPKSLIFGESKEEALIYYFTKRDVRSPSFT